MNLEEIKGIGPKTINLLKKLDIDNTNSLLEYYPYRYNFLNPKHLNDIEEVSGLVNGIISDVPKVFYIKRNLNRLSFKLLVDNNLVNVTIFNRAFMKNHLTVGKEIAVIGKYDRFKNSIVASDIKLESIKEAKIEPVYHLVSGITNKQINKIITNTLSFKYDIEDYIPSIYVDKYNFLSKNDAIRLIHQPKNTQDIKQATLRLIYEEFFTFMFKMNYLKIKRDSEGDGLKRVVDYNKVEEYLNTLSFTLTDDQLTAVKEIYHDLTTKKRMNRLLLGDVGSGKTIVSIIALYINYLGGYQGALMAPTEVLATQHFESLTKLLPDLNIGLIVGSLSKKEKNTIIKKLINNEIDILIGTHALISDDVVFNNLGLVITDEQHRFGVNQRKIMQNKGIKTDVLYMSATPIPRTYAHALYGDMDISRIMTKPRGRKDIITKVVKESNLKKVLENIWEELKKGHQIYVVAPLIEDIDDKDLNDIEKLKDNYTKAFGSNYNIAILHGKMKKQDKNKIMDDYKNHKIDILISTTVIEVGVDVSNATTIVIYNSERFGLATLHQLRGRVGRNSEECYCYLISDKEVERLKVLEESNDGFYISEKDFELRGEGDLFGIKQSGDMSFKLADIRKHSKILMQTKKDSEEYILNFDNNKLYKNIIKELDITN